MQKNIAVIGSGFAGLAAATVLAKEGFKVTVFEKNEQAGGRARTFSANGYLFDMGPSWYWMPDIFEDYYALFGKQAKDFYDLHLLDPAFSIFFGKNDVMDIPGSLEAIYQLFEKEEKGAAEKLKSFLAEAELKYRLSVKELIYLPNQSIFEYLKLSVLTNVHRLDIFKSFHSHIRKYFSNPRLLKLMEFPVLFLGSTSQDTPALYSLMNYAAFTLSTWYPMGGFSEIAKAQVKIAENLGVEIRLNEAVEKIEVVNGKVSNLITSKSNYSFDAVIGASDYHHTEQLLDEKFRNYDENYWNRKTFAPSCLIFYLGINKKIKNLRHHNLFFDMDFEVHADEIYKHPQYPSKPLFYICCPSKTDSSVAPEGHENLFFLMPIAPGLKDDEATREKYFNIIMKRTEEIVQENINDHIDYKKSYCVNDFVSDYNSYKGNAYGLANTLKQTAVLRPGISNKKVDNLFYCGHLTVPGPGVPPSLISGQVAARQLIKKLK